MAQQLSNTDLEKWRQLARYLAHGISQEASGAAVGYSPSRVSQLMQDEEFLALLEEQKTDLLTSYVDLNTAWDAIERTALNNVAKNVRINQDPDFNLRVAMMANRATRRGQDMTKPNRPLDAANADGTRIAISFSVNLTRVVQDGGLRNMRDVEVQRSENNIADPATVQKLMGLADVSSKRVPVGPQPMQEITSLASFLDVVEE